MRTKDVNALIKGDHVTHKQYGQCEVVGFVPEFGPLLHPETDAGLVKLRRHSETNEMFRCYPIDTPILETSFRQILNKL